MTPSLRELIERVEKAEGPQCDIDDDVALYFGLAPKRENYTASLDAATSLVERMRPGWNLCMTTFYRSAHLVPMDDNSGGIGDPHAGVAPRCATLPLAILSALLRALQHQEGSK